MRTAPAIATAIDMASSAGRDIPAIPRPARAARGARMALALGACLWLAGCDQLGIESASAIAAKREAEGKAVGGGCRHAARSIEQCYQENKRADKAAVFAGWREMEDYMRENKIEAVPARPDTVTAKADAAEATEPAEPAKGGKQAKDAKEAKSGSGAAKAPGSAKAGG